MWHAEWENLVNLTHPSLTTYSHPLQLIFCNLWGPSHIQSSLGYNYYISFVDAYSRDTYQVEYHSLAIIASEILWF